MGVPQFRRVLYECRSRPRGLARRLLTGRVWRRYRVPAHALTQRGEAARSWSSRRHRDRPAHRLLERPPPRHKRRGLHSPSGRPSLSG
ncbi:hypothetical protein PSCLAVI8L_180067 [Pseudoclavibacter sp. 8L]|nr:hypothetical protein PSCLAVI8L_180067 [Pseudoclavibacter sp. 8L]